MSNISDARVDAALKKFYDHDGDRKIDVREYMRAALEAADAAAWRPIEEAPKDGTRILVDFGSLGVREVSWTEPANDSWETWCVDDNNHGPYSLRGYRDEGPDAPRRWRFLPTPPKEPTT